MIKQDVTTFADRPAASADNAAPASERTADVLVVRAGPRSRLPVAEHLARVGLSAIVAENVSEALRVLSGRPSIVCLLDLTQGCDLLGL